jgi:hypothetical protein
MSETQKICGNCIHYEPHRDGITKRIHPSQPGSCSWKPNINWAMAYRRNNYYRSEHDPVFHVQMSIYKQTDAQTCKCFETKTKQTQANSIQTNLEEQLK